MVAQIRCNIWSLCDENPSPGLHPTFSFPVSTIQLVLLTLGSYPHALGAFSLIQHKFYNYEKTAPSTNCIRPIFDYIRSAFKHTLNNGYCEQCDRRTPAGVALYQTLKTVNVNVLYTALSKSSKPCPRDYPDTKEIRRTSCVISAWHQVGCSGYRIGCRTQ